MQDMGKSAFDEMKSNDKRTVTLDIMVQTLEGKKFDFLRGMMVIQLQLLSYGWIR